MAYGRWLYKEIETKQGAISLAIYKKNYTGNAIEIDALVADSIVISIDGDGITAPIIGSSLPFSIIDTGQIDTSEFFTPDATMYRVDLSRDGTLEWSGYLTPDSYQESLSYRDNINLIARDNLGRLEEFQFLESKGLQNIETFIADLLSEIGCPQVINWDVRKVSIAKGKGISEVTDCDDIWVNTELFVEKNYKEIVEMILTGLGCQMRYNGYNNLIITSLSDIPSLPTQSAVFINKSGFKEILPAWKDVTITQDYGLIENFFDGYFSKEQVGSSLTFVPSVQMSDKWIIDRGLSNLIFANPYKWAEGIEDGAEESIFPALSKASSAIWKKQVKGSSNMIELKMQLNNTLRRLSNSAYNGIGNLFCGSNDTEDHILEYELTYQFLVSYVDSTGKEKFMSRYGWVDIDDGVDLIEYIFTPINFTTSPCKWDDEGTWDQEQEVTISINNLTEDGELRIYIGNVTWGEKNEVPDNVFFGKIRDIRIAYKLDNGEIASRLQVSDKHNINGRVELEVGQVPVGKGDYLAYAGGFFDSQGLPLTNFKRYYDDINNYILMELVAREHIHFNKDNYMALSGEMISDSPFSFRNNIIYKGERYALISASLAVISNTLSVTNMRQITDYEVAELTVIDSPLESSSGTKVGSGSRQVIQFSNDAGNAKRIYELDFAMDSDDIDNAYAIVDTDRWQEAKRVKVSELGGLFNKAFDVQMDENGNVIAVIAKANLGARGGIAARYQGDWGDTPVTPTINSLGDITDVQITNPTNGQSLVYRDGVWVNEVISGVDGDYLPLSGGILSGNNYVLTINGIDNSYILFDLNMSARASVGYYNNLAYIASEIGGYARIGIADNGEPQYWPDYTGNTKYSLIHSGNIWEQSVARANGLAVGDIRDTNPTPNDVGDFGVSAWFSNVWNPTGATWNSGISVKGWADNYAVWQLAASSNYGGNNQELYFRLGEGTTWNAWRRLLFNNDDNARFLNSSVVDGKYNTALTLQTNVASRANYLCGLAFNCLGAYSSTYENHTHAWIGLGPVVNSAAAEIYPLVFAVNGDTTTGANPIERMRITPNGHVLIGTTHDSGYKLQVEGSFTLSNELFCGGWLRTYSDRGWYNETYGGGIYMTDTNFVKTYGNKGMMSDFYSTSYGKSGEISEVGLNWYRIAKGGYGASMILTIGKNYSHQSPDTQIYAITIGYYQSGGITLLSRGTNHADTNRAIRISRIDSNNYAIDVLMYNSAANTDAWYISGLCSGGWVFQAPELVTDSPYVMQQLDLTWGVGFHTSNSMNVNGNIYASGGITAKTSSSSSDAKLKDNITLLSQEDAINILMALKPSSWNWKDGGELAYGLVAQDVESVLPCSVTYGESLSLQYNMFHAFEISVGQNHETRIRQLEEELQTLKREYYGNR